MAKRGPSDVFAFLDGFDIIPFKLDSLSVEVESVLERSDGLGDDWQEHSPTGQKRASVTQEGAFFDDAAGQSHAVFRDDMPSDPDDAARIMCIGFSGDVAGRDFEGIEGVHQSNYNPQAEQDGLHKADVQYEVTGRADRGVVLHPLSAETAAFDTQATSVDNAASSADGGVAYQQITAFSGTDFTGEIQDSPDDIAFATLVSFAQTTAGPKAQRVTVAGTVDRYLAAAGTGTFSSVTVWIGFARN